MSNDQELTTEVAEKVAFLSSFRLDILAYFDGDGDATVRSRINRGMARARTIVADAGVLKSVTLSPPPAVGGLIVRNADPFNFILEDYFGRSMTPMVADMIEEAIGVLESPEYIRRRASKVPQNVSPAPAPLAAPPVPAREPQLPDKITIPWLVKHVPIRFWFWLVGLLAASFAAGMRWGPLLAR